MTGPEHYREAERLLRNLQTPPADWIATSKKFNAQEMAGLLAGVVAQAQVHATLALAAATMECDLRPTDWFSAIRPYVPEGDDL